MTRPERRSRRLELEASDFDSDHYLCDLYESESLEHVWNSNSFWFRGENISQITSNSILLRILYKNPVVYTKPSKIRIFHTDIHFYLASWYYTNGYCGCPYGCCWMLDRLVSTHPIKSSKERRHSFNTFAAKPSISMFCLTNMCFCKLAILLVILNSILVRIICF